MSDIKIAITGFGNATEPPVASSVARALRARWGHQVIHRCGRSSSTRRRSMVTRPGRQRALLPRSYSGHLQTSCAS